MLNKKSYKRVTVTELQVGDVTMGGYLLLKKSDFDCNGYATLTWLCDDIINQYDCYHSIDTVNILRLRKNVG